VSYERLEGCMRIVATTIEFNTERLPKQKSSISQITDFIKENY
jgi:hypothetical protein